MKGCSLAWNIDPNGITILHQREGDGGKEMEGGWEADEEGSGQKGERVERGKSSLSLPFVFFSTIIVP